MTALQEPTDSVVDIVGIGLGPSNLALATAVEEHNRDHYEDQALRARFFEKQPAFGWHRGMLVEGATMQVSFLKDLATMRNPVSPFGYLSYLKDKDRLVDFINAKSFYPLRVEFHDYLEWVAERFSDIISYSSKVTEVRPVLQEDTIKYLDVVVRCGKDVTVQRTRNIVIATGLEPWLPPGVEAAERIWHSSDLLNRIELFASTKSPRSFAVIGSGQSAAEAVEYLHSRFPEAAVHAVFSRYGYSVADDSPFANRIFNPQAVDHYFGASDMVKEMLLAYHSNTNYSVVDLDVIDQLYRRTYLESVTGRQRLHVHNVSRVRGLEPGPDGVRIDVEFLPTAVHTPLHVDAAVYATGYRPSDPVPLLGQMASLCKQDEHGRVDVRRDYRVSTAGNVHCGIYLQSSMEHSHGITASLLSNTAVRAGEITRSILGHRTTQ
ncbi:SidA/IucD/PvdA family monooxygenase [Streptomyces sp. NPDC126514]|uniref:lysine N(6)-hydroxylase/L-ornithine N(5)-oxygenase family protein n=1 Tax=Streptomyces sp. NPDC126514 TaxID=3155210 RepID=UPI003317F3EA